MSKEKKAIKKVSKEVNKLMINTADFYSDIRGLIDSTLDSRKYTEPKQSKAEAREVIVAELAGRGDEVLSRIHSIQESIDTLKDLFIDIAEEYNFEIDEVIEVGEIKQKMDDVFTNEFERDFKEVNINEILKDIQEATYETKVKEDIEKEVKKEVIDDNSKSIATKTYSEILDDIDKAINKMEEENTQDENRFIEDWDL